MMTVDFLKHKDENKNSHPINIFACDEIINGNSGVEEIEFVTDSLTQINTLQPLHSSGVYQNM